MGDERSDGIFMLAPDTIWEQRSSFKTNRLFKFGCLPVQHYRSSLIAAIQLKKYKMNSQNSINVFGYLEKGKRWVIVNIVVPCQILFILIITRYFK